MIWKLREREIGFPRRPLVMGVVNVNDDSFAGDGTLDVNEAIQRAIEQLREGADIIDVGAESARTNREAISEAEEIRRFHAFLERWQDALAGETPRDEVQVWPPVISANTWRPEVVKAVLGMGVELVNDMGGLPDGRNAKSCAQVGASLLIMHSVGEPKVPHRHQQWVDVMGSMESFFAEKIRMAREAGMELCSLVLDPGIDFAKQRDDNLTVFRQLPRLLSFECPLLVPVSRKTVIGEVLDLDQPKDRDAGTAACVSASIRRGASIVRVHDVKMAYQTVCALNSIVG